MALQRIDYSVGFVVTLDDESEEWSFRVHPNGTVEVLGDWDYRGPLPQVSDNPPPNDNAVHTLAISEWSDAVQHGLWYAVTKHRERFGGECSVYVADGAPRELVDWVAAGCPDVPPEPEPEPEVEPEPTYLDGVKAQVWGPDAAEPREGWLDRAHVALAEELDQEPPDMDTVLWLQQVIESAASTEPEPEPKAEEPPAGAEPAKTAAKKAKPKGT